MTERDWATAMNRVSADMSTERASDLPSHVVVADDIAGSGNTAAASVPE